MPPTRKRKRPVSPAQGAACGEWDEVGVTPALPPREGSGGLPGRGQLQPGWVEGGGGAGGGGAAQQAQHV
ncbi:hypothetical protein HaLaN_02242 [Haematococcus lacustris]|uniref:Uncharacterized protein n=1 Tax=Haematococcus lacustris TaxID=44745 RepID=A0A699YB97_HAELA|nr:hypothetical protein HaLaN_02242 [Haematococcus lacustris]